MARELNARDLKLVQYLNEAYGKEKELETALTADISMTTDKAYRKRLQDHLKETRNHRALVKSRIRAIGGKAEEVSVPGRRRSATSRAAPSTREPRGRRGEGPVAPAAWHRRAGEAPEERQVAVLERVRGDRHLHAIETLADAVGDKETAKIAREIRREEERMAKFLEKLIPRLTKGVAREEIPPRFATAGASASSSSRRRTTSSKAQQPSAQRRAAAEHEEPRAQHGAQDQDPRARRRRAPAPPRRRRARAPGRQRPRRSAAAPAPRAAASAKSRAR